MNRTPPSVESPRNGSSGGSPNGRNGVIGRLIFLSQSVVSALPPAFLLLVILNVAFLGLIMWFLDAQQERRADLFEKIIDKCLVQAHDR